VRVNGEVHGDVEVRAEELEIGPDARIGGRLVYRGPAAPVVPEGAVIAGGVEFHEQARGTGSTNRGRACSSPGTASARSRGCGRVHRRVAVPAALPALPARGGATVGRRPWQSLGLGLAILVCVPFVGVVLLITIIGIPLALLLVRSTCWCCSRLDHGGAVHRPARTRSAAPRAALDAGVAAARDVPRPGRAVAGQAAPLRGGLIGFVALLAGIGALAWRAFSGQRAAAA